VSGAPAAWEPTLRELAAGAISPPVALARLLMSGDPPDTARLARLAEADPAAAPLAALASHVRLEKLADLARSGIDPSGDEIGATRALFDRLAEEAPEPGVALYALGDPALLGAATAELVEVIRNWSPVEGRALLDLGCGIGRVAIALAPDAREVIGLDLSPNMLAEARARAAAVPNLRFVEGNGRDLAMLADGSIDLALAADSFPFLVRAGPEVMAGMTAEIARVLRPAGDFLVFNWSYRGDVGRDIAEAYGFAETFGFTVLRAGERPFRLWDGIGFHLRRAV